MRGLLYSLVLCLGLMPVAEAQQTNPPVQSAPAPNPSAPNPSAPNPSAPILPAPGSLTTPPAPPVTQPVQPPSAAQDPTPQPPGTAPQTDGVKTPEVGGPTELVLEAKPVILFRGQSTWDDGFDTLMESVAAKAPMHQLATIDDVGSAAAWLVSDQARRVTGQVIYVDGGASIIG